jgi:diguanylate cyclase (GGDEF)-like protein/PAS domain S-box-containing protein
MQLDMRAPGLGRGALGRRFGLDELLAVGLIGYAVVYASWQLLGWGGETQQVLIADAIYLPLGLLVVSIALRASFSARQPGVRRAWRWFAGAFVAYSLADFAWFYIEIVQGTAVPTPSIADVGYLAFYPLMVLGLLALPRGAQAPDGRRLLDLAIICTASLASVWWLVVGPMASALGSAPVQGLVAVAYPAGDVLVIFALATAVLGRVRGVPSAALLLLGFGLACNMVADLVYARVALEGSYVAGGWLDVAYTVGWLSLGFAGVVQMRSARMPGTPVGTAHLRPIPALPYLATVFVLGLVAISVRAGSVDQQALIAGAIGVTLLVSVRQYLTARQNTRLLGERLRGEERFHEILRNAADAVVVADRDGLITYATPSAPALVAAGGSDTLVGTAITRIVQPTDAPLLREMLRTLGQRAGSDATITCRSASTPARDLEVSVVDLLANELVGGIVVTFRDVTERFAFEAELRTRALHDPLTGLANRVLFNDRLEQALRRAHRRPTRPAVLYLDLDAFKSVNDTLGHTSGDEVLVEAARRLLTVLRPEDTAARLGGDEFGVLIEDTSEVAEAVSIAERIRDALAAPFRVAGRDLFISASVGIVRSKSPSDDGVTLLRDADIAMYEAKRASRGGYQVFTDLMYEQTVDRVRLEADLHVALDAGQLEVVYQAVIDLHKDTVAGVEALLRWHHPTRGLLLPEVFIPVAEATGEISRIGLWVLEESCRRVNEWNRRLGERPLRANVNVSFRQLKPSFVADVLDVLERTAFPTRLLVLELTESVFADGSQAVVDILSELRGHGIRIAIDDFGTGYSSLGYLRELPVDELKIDRSFVDRLAGQVDQGLVSAIIRLGRELDLGTVAEGIESPEQLALLRELGCDLGQGYLLGRPGSPDDPVVARLTSGGLASGRDGFVVAA